MLEKDSIINKIKYLLDELIDPIAEKTEKPGKKGSPD